MSTMVGSTQVKCYFKTHFQHQETYCVEMQIGVMLTQTCSQQILVQQIATLAVTREQQDPDNLYRFDSHLIGANLSNFSPN